MTENPDAERPDETTPFPATPEPSPHGDPVAPPPPAGPPSDSGYGQPTYGQPTYASQTVHAQPVYTSPGYGQPAYSGMGGYSDKSKVVAGLLQILLPFIGICGVGRLYAGHVGIGLAQLLGMFGGFLLAFVLIGFVIVPAIWLWTVIDGIVMLTGDAKDGQGRLLRP